ncbi:MAG: CDP-alcohol phosphatidyltransferase family protein [Spirochaetes bacterium]|nr:CDP-alcohol phosphatidyltransferase family protein [Spirochaetota bacterium]
MEQAKAIGFKKLLPNIATIIRILGSFSLLFLTNFVKDIGSFKAVPWVWLIGYLFLVLTDSIDGMLARKLNAKSNLGALLDSLADVVLLVIGAATVFAVFAHDSLTNFQLWFYVCLIIFCANNRLIVNLVSKKYFGTANMLHSYPQKAFAAGCFIAVAYWAFMRDVPLWSVVLLVSISIYCTIDEIVYCVRAAKYDIDFKGHGFQKYELRKNKKD